MDGVKYLQVSLVLFLVFIFFEVNARLYAQESNYDSDWQLVEKIIYQGSDLSLIAILPGDRASNYLIELLKLEKNTEMREGIAHRLFYRNNPACIEILKPYLISGKPLFRIFKAVDALKTDYDIMLRPLSGMSKEYFFSDSRVDVFQKLMEIGADSEDPYTSVQCQAILLDEYGRTDMIEKLESNYESSDFSIKLLAAKYLILKDVEGYQGKIFPQILELLKNGSDTERREIASFLLETDPHLNDEYFYPVVDLLLKTDYEFPLKEIPYDQVSFDFYYTYELLAADLLKSHNKDTDVPYLKNLLKSKEVRTRAVAAVGLLAHGQEKDPEFLIEQLKSLNTIEGKYHTSPYDLFYSNKQIFLDKLPFSDVKKIIQNLQLTGTEKSSAEGLLIVHGDKETLDEMVKKCYEGTYDEKIEAIENILLPDSKDVPADAVVDILKELSSKTLSDSEQIRINAGFVSLLNTHQVFEPKIAEQIQKLLSHSNKEIQLEAAGYLLRYNYYLYYMKHNQKENTNANQ